MTAENPREQQISPEQLDKLAADAQATHERLIVRDDERRKKLKRRALQAERLDALSVEMRDKASEIIRQINFMLINQAIPADQIIEHFGGSAELESLIGSADLQALIEYQPDEDLK